MRSHTVTCHPTQVNAILPAPIPQAGTRFTYPGGMEGWVDLSYPATERPGVELATSRSQVRRPNHCTTEPPYYLYEYRRCRLSENAVTYYTRQPARSTGCHSDRDCFDTWAWRQHRLRPPNSSRPARLNDLSQQYMRQLISILHRPIVLDIIVVGAQSTLAGGTTFLHEKYVWK